MRLRDRLETALLEYREERSADGAGLISLLLDQLRVFVDLSQVAKTSRNELGNDTNEYLLDIFGRGVTPYCHFIARPLNGKTAGTFSLYLT